MGHTYKNITILIVTNITMFTCLQCSLHGHTRGFVRQRPPRDLEFECESLRDTVACNITNVLADLLQGYDNRFRPYEGSSSPLIVKVGMRILNLGNINEVDMDYQVDMHLVQEWKDPRLSNSHPGHIHIPNAMVKKVWMPDTFFLNSKHAKHHKITVPNSILVLKPDGSLIYSTRIGVRASCQMDFHNYPADTQKCDLHIESLGHSADEILYQWRIPHRLNISISGHTIRLPQRNITSFTMVEMTTVYMLGKTSTLIATFTIQRHLDYFFVHLYSPCACLVCLSWVSFFIPKERVGARIKLCIVATLTISTILNSVNKVLPQVAYIKLVDWYLIISILFVYCVFVEYTFVLWLTEREMLRIEELAKEEKLTTDDDFDPNATEDQLNLKTFGNHSGDPTLIETINLPEDDTDDDSDVNDEPEDDEDKESQSLASTHTVYFVCFFRLAVIDEIARIVFPLAYAIFNMGYWWYFFSSRSNPSTHQE